MKVRVFFSKDNGAFFPLTPLRIDFSCIFDNLITHERDLLLGLKSSLDIHTSAFNFCHLAGGTVPSSEWRDSLWRYRLEALLAQELPRSRELLLERQHETNLVTISVLLSVHRSLSPPTDHSGGDGIIPLVMKSLLTLSLGPKMLPFHPFTTNCMLAPPLPPYLFFTLAIKLFLVPLFFYHPIRIINFQLSITILKSGKKQDKKLYFILKFKAW